MIIGDMEIRLRADIARLQRDMDSARQVVGNATAGMERAANAAKGAIASIAAGLGVRELGRMVDEYAKFTSQLKLATTSQREYAAAYADVKRIATQSTQGLMETGVLYARIANGTRELGVEQKKVSQIVETVNLALVVSGAAASESASAQLQLSQAFASGTLRGEEFNSVNEAAPRLMKALADGMGLPVGALKKMAEEGKITSKIMADVLPVALEKLRVEAKEIQTISGAFTVLRNNVMEFVGVQANASGAVSGLVSAIGLLSSNLGLLAGVITTLGVSKLVTMFQSWGVATYKQIADNNALRTSTLAGAVASTEAASVIAAAKLAEAQANVRTAASAANLAAARVAELRSSVLAAEGAVALAIATNGLIPAQARAIALSEAHALALAGQAVAANGATVSAGAASAALTAQAAATGVAARAMGVLRGAMTFMGGPIGTIITLLGLAATAWMVWGNKSKEATEKAAESFDEAQVRIIKGLDEQIDKNEKLLKLRNLGVAKSDAEKQLPFVNQLAAASERLNQVNMRAGEFSGKSNTDIEFARIGVLRDITDLTQKMAKADSTSAAVAAQSVNERVKAFKKEYATKQEQRDAELKAIEDLKGKTAEYGEMERRIREKYADKSVTAGIKAEATAYQNLVTSIGEKAAANDLEMSGYAKLSDSQKMTIKLDEAIASGKNKLTPAHVAETRSLIAKVAAQESAIEEGAFYLQQAEQQAQLSATAIKAADDEAERNEELARTFGMSKLAIEELTLARLQEKLAQADTSKGYTREIAELEAVIDAKKRSIAAISKIDQMEANKKVADQAAEDWKRATESIEKSLTDALLRGFESGKSFGKNLIDTLKNMFSTLVLRPVIQGVMQPFAGQVNQLGQSVMNQFGLGGATGAASAGGSGIGGTISAVKGIYDAMQGGFAALGDTVAGFSQTVMSSMGYTPLASQGLATAGGQALTPMASGLGAAAGIAAGAFGGVMGGRAISNGYSAFGGSGNGTVNAGTAIGAAVGSIVPVLGTALGALVGGLLGGTVNRLFGHKPKEVQSTDLAGTLGPSGFDGNVLQAWTQKGGVFRSDKKGVDKAPVATEMDQALSDAYGMMKVTTKAFAEALGADAASIATRTDAIKIAVGKTDAETQANITAYFETLANKMATDIVPQLVHFQKAGESASAALQRLSTSYAVIDDTLASIGGAFGAIGVSSIGARERMLELAGGLDAFAANTAFFQQNFLSEAERTAPVLKAVTAQMAALGLAGVDTREEFKKVVLDLVNSGALATEAGAKQHAALMNLQQAFATVYPAMEQASESVASATSALTEAYKAQVDEVGATINRMGAFATSLRNLRESALLGDLSPLSPQQKYAEAKAQYESVLAAARSGDESAQSNYSTAFNSFLTASRAVFASGAQYQNDFAYAQASTADAERWASAQVDVGKAQLDALKLSVSGLIDVKSEVMSFREAFLQMHQVMGTTAPPAPGAMAAPQINMPTPVMYASYGKDSSVALVSEIKRLNGLVEKLTAEQNAQTGDIIKANAIAARESADAIAKANTTAVKSVANNEQRVPFE